MESTERIVVVTGASQGIGAATTRALLVDPTVRVIAVGRNLEPLVLATEDETRCERCAVDLLEEDAVPRILAQVAGRRLHGLLHNAGVLDTTPMGQHQRTTLERVFATNVFVPLELTQALAPQLEGTPPGHIVHIGSMGGFQDATKFPGLVAYSSSKAALACMAQCIAEEYKDSGVRSNCLAIGAVDTAMLRAAFPDYTAPVSAQDMGAYVAEFILNGHKLFNGKVLPVAVDTP